MAKKKKKRNPKKDAELDKALRDFFKNASPAQIKEWEKMSKRGNW